jgi:arginyl-tRNA synthetase
MALTYLERFIHDSIGDAYRRLRNEPPTVSSHVRPSDRPEFGDYSSSLAMIVASEEGLAPHGLAADLVATMRNSLPTGDFAEVDVAGPGFINLFLTPTRIQTALRHVLDTGESYGRQKRSEPKRLQIEFVSSNPTGPLTVGHGRQAVLGDVLANLYERLGYDVQREYYFNDEGRQIDLLAESLWVRYRELLGESHEIPEDGYRGEYLKDVARQLTDEMPDGFPVFDEEAKRRFRSEAVARMTARIKEDLETLDVRFDEWFSEATLHRSGEVNEALAALREHDGVYEKDGAIWLKAEEHGGAKDSVLVRSDGRPTYLLVDVAYHINKKRRGFDRVVNVQGADHHAELACVKAALRILGYPEEWLCYAVHQFVSLKEGGKTLKMSTRAGRFVTLRDLLDELGGDIVRYFMISRKPEAHLDFDLDLARSASLDNPATYVQYAHTRIASIFRRAEGTDIDWADVDLSPLVERDELDLIKTLDRFPTIVETAAGSSFAPHLIADYALQLSRAFHAYYDKHRVLTDDEGLSRARLALLSALQTVLRSSLAILGMDAPLEM